MPADARDLLPGPEHPRSSAATAVRTLRASHLRQDQAPLAHRFCISKPKEGPRGDVATTFSTPPLCLPSRAVLSPRESACLGGGTRVCVSLDGAKEQE